MKIAYVLYLFNRSEHSIKVIQSLICNEVKEVIVFLDKPKSEKDKEQQVIILDYIDKVKDIKFNLNKRSCNYGLASSIRSGLAEVFRDGYDAAIVLEDDCVLEKNGKLFFESGLRALKNNTQVRSLCGYLNRPHSFVFTPDSDMLLLKRFNTWGWATWANRWKDYDSDLQRLVDKEAAKGVKISDYSLDIARYCSSEKYLKHEVDIWSVNWILIHYITKTFCVYPYESVICNVGFDGSGSNCAESSAFCNTIISKDELIYNWDNLNYFMENDETIDRFMMKNSQKIYPPL
jgi:hypothetical protein